MGKGGYLYWQKRKLHAANTAYAQPIQRTTIIPDEAPIENRLVTFPNITVKRRIANTAYFTFSTFGIPELPTEVPEEVLRKYPDRARRKKVSNQAYWRNASFVIADEVTGLKISAIPDRALKKKVSAEAYKILLSPQLPDPVPEGSQVLAYRLIRKVAAREAYSLINGMAVPAIEALPPSIYIPIQINRRRGARVTAYLIIQGPASLSVLHPLLFADTEDAIVVYSNEDSISVSDTEDATVLKDNL